MEKNERDNNLEDIEEEEKKIDPTVKIPSKANSHKLIVILEQCTLELTRTKK